MTARLVSFVVVLLLASPCWAETALSATFVSHFQTHADFAPLRDAGFEPSAMLVVERLPDGRYAAEFMLTHAETKVRWPVVARQAKNDWSIVWQPKPIYATAFANMVRSGQLPKAYSAKPWTDGPRLPALPIVITAKRIITPFGACDPKQTLALEGGELKAIKPLAKHVNFWLQNTLAQDPGPASVDVLVDRTLTWRAFNDTLLTVAMQGLYKINIIVNTGEGVGVLPFAAPAMKLPDTALVVGMYHAEEAKAFRFGVGEKTYLPESSKSPCPAKTSICATDVSEFQTLLNVLAQHPYWGDLKSKYMIVAATGEFSVGEVLDHASLIAPTLRLTPAAVFLGFIQ